MNRSIELIQQIFEPFVDGVRVSMLIDRSKGNTNKGSKRWVNKIISTDRSHWLGAVYTLLEMQKHINNPNIRLYSCLNDRKMDSAIKWFQHDQLDVLPENKDRFYCSLNDRFCSALMKPENKKSKLFLLDIDTKDTLEVDRFVADNLIEIKALYPTPNGWHYVVEPFNIILAKNATTFEVKRDALLLINWIGKEEK